MKYVSYITEYDKFGRVARKIKCIKQEIYDVSFDSQGNPQMTKRIVADYQEEISDSIYAF